MIGNGIGPGAKAFRARASRTVESLPPEKSRHGRRISATTSRKMKMLSDSRARRWLRTCAVKGSGLTSVRARRDGIIARNQPSAPRAHRRSDLNLDLSLAVGGLLVGSVVGLTGMGGGALMTPMLVFFFGADPLTATSSHLPPSCGTKP